MSFFKFWQKPKKRDSFDKDLLNIDLFSQLTHIAGIATSGLSRDQVFAQACELPYHSATYFRKVRFLVHELNYDYSEACRVVGERAEENVVKELLLRLASSLIAGEPEATFFAREAYVMGETYGNEYERQVESLSKWTDAYMVLIISAATIITIGVVSMVIYPVSPTLIVVLSAVAFFVAGIGSWILYRAAPKEVKTHALPQCSRDQAGARLLLRICAPAAIVTCSLLAALGLDLGWIVLAGGVILFPPGMVIMRDDKRIDRQDGDIGGFLRSLGGVTRAIGSTVTEGLGRLNFRSLGSLQDGVKALHVRLSSGIRPDLCWTRFISETGSELVNRSTQVFWSCVKLGGDPQEVGKASSAFALKISLLRAKRRMVSNSFSWLCITMHGATAALLMLIYQIMFGFTAVFQHQEVGDATEALSSMPFGELFNGMPLQLLQTLTITLIMVLAVANAIAIKATEGGHNYKFLFYLGIMLAVSGAVLELVPRMGAVLFTDMLALE